MFKKFRRSIRLLFDRWRLKHILKGDLKKDDVGLFVESNTLSDFQESQLINKGYVIISNSFISSKGEVGSHSTRIEIMSDPFLDEGYSYITNNKDIKDIFDSMYKIYRVSAIDEDSSTVYIDPERVFIDLNDLLENPIKSMEILMFIFTKVMDKEYKWISLFICPHLPIL